jgi:hypothetical protein
MSNGRDALPAPFHANHYVGLERVSFLAATRRNFQGMPLRPIPADDGERGLSGRQLTPAPHVLKQQLWVKT